MRTFTCVLAPVVALNIFTPAVATPSKTTPPRSPETITCREFVDLDNVFKPQAVSYVIGYDRAKRAHVESITVEGIDRIVPVMVDSCRARPAGTLLDRVKAYWRKL